MCTQFFYLFCMILKRIVLLWTKNTNSKSAKYEVFVKISAQLGSSGYQITKNFMIFRSFAVLLRQKKLGCYDKAWLMIRQGTDLIFCSSPFQSFLIVDYLRTSSAILDLKHRIRGTQHTQLAEIWATGCDDLPLDLLSAVFGPCEY